MSVTRVADLEDALGVPGARISAMVWRLKRRGNEYGNSGDGKNAGKQGAWEKTLLF